jgi:hypothetical protein
MASCVFGLVVVLAAVYAPLSALVPLQKFVRVTAVTAIETRLRRVFSGRQIYAWGSSDSVASKCEVSLSSSALRRGADSEDDEAIHFRAISGLCNRIRAVASAIILAQDTCRPLVIHWQDVASECGFRLHDFTDARLVHHPILVSYDERPAPDPNVYMEPWDPYADVVARWKRTASQPGAQTHIVSGDTFYRTDADRWLSTLAAVLVPTHEVLQRIELLLRDVPLLPGEEVGGLQSRDCVGVHIRRGDHGDEDAPGWDWTQQAPVSAFQEVIAGWWHQQEGDSTDTARAFATLPRLSNGTVVLVASDNLAVHERLGASQDGGRDDSAKRKVVSMTGGAHVGPETNRADRDSMMWAAAELFALSTCHAVVGSFYSTFSFVAAARSSRLLLLPQMIVPQADEAVLAALRRTPPRDIPDKLSVLIICGPSTSLAGDLRGAAPQSVFPWQHAGRLWVLLGQAGGGPFRGVDADGCLWPYVNLGVQTLPRIQ